MKVFNWVDLVTVGYSMLFASLSYSSDESVTPLVPCMKISSSTLFIQVFLILNLSLCHQAQCLQVLVPMFVCYRSWWPSRPEFRSWRWKKRPKGWRRRRTDVVMERCSSWPAARGLVRQPVVSSVTCCTAKHWYMPFWKFQQHIFSQVCSITAYRQVR